MNCHMDWVHSISSWLRRGKGARGSASSIVCWALYLETDTADGSSSEMVGLYFSESEARVALAAWEVELARHPEAHVRRPGTGNTRTCGDPEPASSSAHGHASRARVRFAPFLPDELRPGSHRRG